MNEHAPWTLGELTARVAAALAVGYRGQSSGRVRDLPDQRAIRWYTTLGLVDRPSAMRGRTALYGRRHLLQLVAIKRLQAAGRSLAEVQQELAASSDERLERLADLPATAAAPPGMAVPAGMAATAAPSRAAPASTPRRQAGEGRRRFWAAGAAAVADGPAAPADATGQADSTEAEELAGPGEATPPPDRPTVAQLQAVQLANGVTLLLGTARPLDGEDLLALQAAARPLLAVVHTRGLHRHATGRELP
jgi:DNA-binding transcriptional MerR regulator